MLQLFTNGQQLDTSNVKSTLTSKNPLFTPKLEGSYVYNISFPATDRNNKTFGYPGRLQKNGSPFQGSFKAIFNGVEIIEDATIIVNKVTESAIQCSVTVGLGNIIYQLKDLLLKDIDLGGDRALTGEVFVPIDDYNDAAAGSYPDYDFVLFPVYNENFYDGTDQETEWKANGKIINEYYTGSFQATSAEDIGNTFVPFPYVVYILNRIFNQFGYAQGENVFFKNSDLRSLVLIGNNAPFETVVVEDPGPPITYTFSTKSHHSINLADQVPEYKVLDFLNDLRFLSIGYFINPFTKKLDIKFFKDILKSTDYTDLTSIVTNIRSKDVGYLFNGFKFKYSLSDDSWGEEYFNNELTKYILKDPVATPLDLPVDDNTEINEVRLAMNIDTYFIFRWDEDSSVYSWFYFSYHFEDLIMNGNASFDIEPDCCPLFVEKIVVNNPTTRLKLLPKIGQPGTNKLYLLSETKEPFINFPGKRFCFYRGLQQDSLSGSYPLGTPDVYDLSGSKITNANLALKWEGEYGLYEKLWRPVIENFILKTKEVEIEARMSASEFKNFDYSKKIRVDGIEYLVKEIKLPISENEIGPAVMTCYTV